MSTVRLKVVRRKVQFPKSVGCISIDMDEDNVDVLKREKKEEEKKKKKKVDDGEESEKKKKKKDSQEVCFTILQILIHLSAR